MKTLARFALLIVLILVMPVPAAPALPFKSKVTRQNYEKIHKGMTKAQVKKILGKPTEMKSETGSKTWESSTVGSTGTAALW